MTTADRSDALRDAVARATAAAADSAGRDDVGRAVSAAILDGLLRPAVDWRALVERWPLCSVAAAGLAGFLLGRRHGAAVLAGVSAGVGRHLVERLEVLGDELAEGLDRDAPEPDPGAVSVATQVPPEARRPVPG